MQAPQQPAVARVAPASREVREVPKLTVPQALALQPGGQSFHFFSFLFISFHFFSFLFISFFPTWLWGLDEFRAKHSQGAICYRAFRMQSFSPSERQGATESWGKFKGYSKCNARSCQVMSGHVRSCQVMSGNVRSCQVMSGHVSGR